MCMHPYRLRAIRHKAGHAAYAWLNSARKLNPCVFDRIEVPLGVNENQMFVGTIHIDFDLLVPNDNPIVKSAVILAGSFCQDDRPLESAQDWIDGAVDGDIVNDWCLVRDLAKNELPNLHARGKKCSLSQVEAAFFTGAFRKLHEQRERAWPLITEITQLFEADPNKISATINDGDLQAVLRRY